MTDERLREEQTTHDKTEFRTKLDALIGQPTGGFGKPTVAPSAWLLVASVTETRGNPPLTMLSVRAAKCIW